MRIIGGKRDYYDTASAFGIDEQIMFVRSGDRRLGNEDVYGTLNLPKAICSGKLVGNAEGPPILTGLSLRTEMPGAYQRNVEHVIGLATVVMCGTLRRGMHIQASERYGVTRKIDQRWIWTADALRSYAQDHGLEVADTKDGTIRSWQSEWMTMPPGQGNVKLDVPKLGFDSWFAPVAIEGASLEALVMERITILSRNPLDRIARDADGVTRAWHVDQPTLMAMEYAKAVPPAIAFQEISMWRGGVLGNDAMQPPQIHDNAVKIAKHGFDERSFRKDKAQTR